MRVNKLNEEYTSDDLYRDVTQYVTDLLRTDIDTYAKDVASQFPEYSAEWSCGDADTPSLRRAAEEIAYCLTLNAPDVIHENMNKVYKGMPLTEGKWTYTLKVGKQLRDAIENEDYETLRDTMKEAYREITRVAPDYFDEQDLEYKFEDLDMLDTEPDEEIDVSWEDIQNNWDYELEDLYDRCDAIGIWIPIE